MSIHCIRGCTRKGRHLSNCSTPCACQCHNGAHGAYQCSTPGGCYEQHKPNPECKGCEPVLATIGQLCTNDHARLAENIGRIPDLITHVREMVQPGAVRRDSMVKSTRTPPAPLALDAVDGADALYAALNSWHDTATDELELSPFTRHGWSTTAARGQITGMRAGGTRDDSAAIATRLLTHLERICQYPWVADMATEIGAVVRSSLKRWPDEERPVYLPTPCPECDMLTLVRHAPETFKGRVTISCHRPECPAFFTEEGYASEPGKALARRANDEGRAA